MSQWTPEEIAEYKRIVLKHFPRAEPRIIEGNFHGIHDPEKGVLGYAEDEDGAWISALVLIYDVLKLESSPVVDHEES